MTCANASQMVDLPSLGRADVMPTTLFGVLKLPRSVASLIERIPSAKREKGELTAKRPIVFLALSFRSPVNCRAAGPSTDCGGKASREFAIAAVAGLPNGHHASSEPPNRGRLLSALPNRSMATSTAGMDARQLTPS